MKRILFIAATVLLVPIQVFSLGGKEKAGAGQASALPQITLIAGTIKGPSGIGMVHLFASPPQLPQNASILLQTVASADAMAAKMIAGELDIAVLPVNMAAKLYNSGIDYPVLAVVGNGMVKVISTDPGITGIKDLKSKDVYIAGQGATPEFLMRTLFKAASIDTSTDVNLIFSMPYPEMAASIVAGRIAVAVLPEPFATQALRGNKDARDAFPLLPLWKAATGFDDYPMTVVVVKKSVLAERPLAVAAFLAAYRQSIEKIVADPVQAGALTETYDLGMKAAIASSAIPVSNYVFIDAMRAKKSIQGLLEIFLAAAPVSIGGKLPQDSFYFTLPDVPK